MCTSLYLAVGFDDEESDTECNDWFEILTEDLPLCALQDDRIVEMHGEPVKVHKAIELAVSYLRKFLVDRSVLPLFELNVSWHKMM